jgi:hypothetical protein
MATQSEEFYERLRKSHTSISFVDVIAPDQETVRLKLLDGEVSCDRTAQIRRGIRCNAVDPTGEITPRRTGEILTPYGTELRAYRGIRWQNNDGTTSEEVAPLGVFRLSRSSITYKADGTSDISLEGYDRSRTIQRDKFTAPYVVDSGTNVIDAIKEIVKRTFPGAEYDAITSTLTTSSPTLLDTGSDPWEACRLLAQSVGCEIYFDVLGRVVIAPPPEIHALPAPDFSYYDSDGGHFLDLGRDFSDEGGYNGVIVTGESPGDELPPVRGEAWDETPTSPTYRFGNYGEVPAFVTDNNAKTDEECEQIAKSQLALVIGAPAQLSMTALVNPSYEAGDVVHVKLTKAGVDGLYGVDAFNVPFAASATQRLALRERSAG